MKSLSIATFLFALIVSGSARTPNRKSSTASAPGGGLLGFRDAASESAIEARFLAVPDPKLAEQHLRTLTQAPHMAGTIEDKATADYVAQKFREAGLDTEIVEYKVWINYPSEISVDLTAPTGVEMHGPTREHVDGDPFQDDPRVVMPFTGMSPSGDVEADVVYANYGSPDDFEKIEKMKIDVRGKIVLVRYGQNFRGVKAFVAQEHGAAGVIIYSDPADDGWRRGDKYPEGPWRPDTGVQRGSIARLGVTTEHHDVGPGQLTAAHPGLQRHIEDDPPVSMQSQERLHHPDLCRRNQLRQNRENGGGLGVGRHSDSSAHLRGPS